MRKESKIPKQVLLVISLVLIVVNLFDQSEFSPDIRSDLFPINCVPDAVGFIRICGHRNDLAKVGPTIFFFFVKIGSRLVIS